MKLKLNTKDESLREILGNGKHYFVPMFQRDYSWEYEHWEMLWDDIQFIINNQDEYHYMGYLVLQETDNQGFKIIDGQQRLTTFSLFTLAAIKCLQNADLDESRRISVLRRSFIKSEGPTLREVNTIKLNRNNDYYYNEAVIGNELPKRGKKKTVILMGKALAYFEKVLKQKTGEEIGRIIEVISQNLLFTTIYIGDELNAYKVFETLNARGAQLSSGDLLKNYIFSIIDSKGDTPSDVLDRLEQKWESIGEDIGDNHYTDYILMQWNATHKIVRKTALFKNIRQEIKTTDQANAYLNTLAQNSQLYSALLNPDSEFWKEHPDYLRIKQDLEFFKLFHIKQPISLFYIAYLKQANDFTRILRWVKVLSLRYNVIARGHTGEQEELYNAICLMINNGDSTSDIKQKILELYPEDEKFKQLFKDKSMPTQQSNKKARYLLARLSEQGGNPVDEAILTVEHILPLNPNEQWIDSFGDNWQLFNKRLGNMALVTKTMNKELGQKAFEAKRDLLEQSPYAVNAHIQEYDEWNSQTVESRQGKLANMAAHLWRID